MKKLLFITLLGVLGCKGNRLSNRGDSGPINVVFWGQSNATRATLWDETARLIEESTGRQVNTYSAAVSATSSDYWARDINHIQTNLADLVIRIQPQYVLCIQGEGDQGTPQQTYFDNMKTVLEHIHRVSRGSKCYMALDNLTTKPQEGDLQTFHDVRGAQMDLVKSGLALLGPDVDQYRTPEFSLYQFDQQGLHFNEKGDKQIASDFVRDILKGGI